MNKATAKQIAKLWNANFAGHTEETMTSAIVEDDSVNIYPVGNNEGKTFYHTEDLTDITRAFRMNCIVTLRDSKVIARIF